MFFHMDRQTRNARIPVLILSYSMSMPPNPIQVDYQKYINRQICIMFAGN